MSENALQNLLVFAVKGVGYWADMARAVGAKDDEVDQYVIKALASIDNGDDNTLSALAAKAPALQKQAKEAFEKKNGRTFSGFLPAAGKALQISEDRAEQVAMGGQVCACRVDKEIIEIRRGILASLKKIASAGKLSDEAIAVVEQGLGNMCNDKMEIEDLDAYVKVLDGFVK